MFEIKNFQIITWKISFKFLETLRQRKTLTFACLVTY